MFSKELPAAIPRTTQAVQNGANAQRRAAQSVGESWTDAGRTFTDGWEKNYDDFVIGTGGAVSRVKEKLGEIPHDFPIHGKWEIDEPDIPDVPPVKIPTEWVPPDGRKPWDESGPYGPGGSTPAADPTAGYATAGAMSPASSVDTGRGQQTIIVERDGQRDLQYTAENLPAYVRIRAGNTVLGV